MKALLVTALVVFALLLGGDYLVRRSVEGHLEERLTSGLDARRVDVSLPSFPLTLKLLGGRLQTVEVEAASVATEVLDLRDLRVVAGNVRFSFADLIQGKGRVRIGRSRATGTASEDAVNAALESLGGDIRVTIDGDSAVVTSPSLPGEASGSVDVEGNDLVILAEGREAARFEAVPESGDLRLRDAELRDGGVTLTFELSPRALTAGRSLRDGSRHEEPVAFHRGDAHLVADFGPLAARRAP